WGGYETNFVITHTHLFAAAAEAAGVCDLISDYGAFVGSPGSEGPSKSTIHYEIGQGRMGASPWQISELYKSNSPIFKADCITTPLLIMHNKGDARVSWSQGIELFTGLRRLGKKVWMLQY